MDLKEFTNTLLSKIKNKSKHMSCGEYYNAHEKYIEFYKEKNPDEILVIPIEEMAELSQHLSKIMRKKEPMTSNYGCIEELADVQICIDNLKLYFGISDEELKYAIDVKTERNLEKLNDEINVPDEGLI